MPFDHEQWYECKAVAFDLIESPVKKTKAFEIKCEHPDHGSVVGHWWLTDARDKNNVPQWQAAKNRLIKLGCVETLLNGGGWIEHGRENVVGKPLACFVVIEEFEDREGNQRERAVAKFIGIPNGNSNGSGYKRADESVSLFAVKASSNAGDPLAIGDDDLPF